MNGSLPTANARLRRAVGWAVVLFWGAMFVGTHIPMPRLEGVPQHSDKLLHFAAYAGLSFLLGLWRALSHGMSFADYAKVFGATAVYAVFDELLQMIPALNRDGDIDDAAADGAGSIAGLVGLYLVLRCIGSEKMKESNVSRGKQGASSSGADDVTE